MPDLSAEEQRDLEESASRRDQRLALIRQDLDILSELRDSRWWGYISHRVALERGDILARMASVDAGDIGAVVQLKARAIACDWLEKWPDELHQAAQAAEDQISYEDGRRPAD